MSNHEADASYFDTKHEKKYNDGIRIYFTFNNITLWINTKTIINFG